MEEPMSTNKRTELNHRVEELVSCLEFFLAKENYGF